jgi:hypothetical protein
MSDRSLDELAARLNALERSNRALKCLLIAVVGSLLVAGATSGPPKTIEAQELVLKDDKGNVRVRLGMSEMKYALSPSPTPVPRTPQDALETSWIKNAGQSPRLTKSPRRSHASASWAARNRWLRINAHRGRIRLRRHCGFA